MSNLNDDYHPWEIDNNHGLGPGPHWVRKAKSDGVVYFHVYPSRFEHGISRFEHGIVQQWEAVLRDFLNPRHLHFPGVPQLVDLRGAKELAETYYRDNLGIPRPAFERLDTFDL